MKYFSVSSGRAHGFAFILFGEKESIGQLPTDFVE
jgi:hypothetical protein